MWHQTLKTKLKSQLVFDPRLTIQFSLPFFFTERNTRQRLCRVQKAICRVSGTLGKGGESGSDTHIQDNKEISNKYL